MIAHAARRAVRRAWKLRPVVGYTPAEAEQDARIGAWLALARPCREGDDYRLGVAALAGYRQIVDGRRHRYGVSAGGAREDALADAPEAQAPDAAPGLIAVAQALAAMARLRDPLPQVAAWLIEGEEVQTIAARLGVTPSRVSQMRGELREVCERFMEVA